MYEGPLSEAEVASFHEDGYLIVKGYFDTEEIDLLRRSSKEDKALDDHSFGRDDGEGGRVRLSLWNHPGEGIYGMFARCPRLVDAAEQLLDDEVYHYHSKMIMKEPKVGGAWTWHQDYGYWYQNGVLYPDMLSVSIAVDPATRENGCLQLVKGSHKLGRIDHVLSGDQAGANIERVNEITKRLETVYCEMDAGDAVFFHSNTLHRSDANKSDNPRWAMICCYNAKHNDPYKDSHHPRYTPLKKVDDGQIKNVGVKRFEDDASDVSWMQNEDDHSAQVLKEDEE